jgi:hypothetical protein
MPDGWNMWTFWQYREDATINGIFSNGSSNDDAGGSIAVRDAGDGGVQAELAGADTNYFNGTLESLHSFVASTASKGDVPDAPPLTDPPHVSLSVDGGTRTVDCSDGCCVADP